MDQAPIIERRARPRHKSLLKGIVFFDSRRISMDCTIRDLSEIGARLMFPNAANVPDAIEVEIPQKQRTQRARVCWRGQGEIGVAFVDARSEIPRRASDATVDERLDRLETEIAALKRLIKKMTANPNDADAA